MGKKRFWILIAFGLAILVILIVISSIVSVGDKLNRIHPYAEYGFYVFFYPFLHADFKPDTCYYVFANIYC